MRTCVVELLDVGRGDALVKEGLEVGVGARTGLVVVAGGGGCEGEGEGGVSHGLGLIKRRNVLGGSNYVTLLSVVWCRPTLLAYLLRLVLLVSLVVSRAVVYVGSISLLVALALLLLRGHVEIIVVLAIV